ncbi:enoyl-CoA hydratase/isomerase family protein [Burkholderia glumae]|uniref:Enoyl-CoA hydratase/isomerase family protein n=1 Tax=Burkholderia glumae TaxID=337 RepID=A0AAQ0BQG7_BURGL|nr:enoyl-CoA hydratase/isomerase family protein [Burkholderia glumae]ACR31519.1 Enoyl-CoA hydratase/carnithine racemase [Burkholderia glumae BGR1]AJY62940.1 enoyl-CoA hydratase/isomerase family protein [Burkholderia glumae LMG 2196 = ATCC 33617]KHJ62593.1 enoyl-CoA hydratase [Burkholderia glumae]MCM2485320.1 enoyl-CoA hydratase/isomerase family protein [Burkholderia glumae]MCM2511015.1 enoyl-CoA hydratase/isomerase family protein [Burkholderia glumae]
MRYETRYETIRVTEEQRIATVTLARPEVRNAFNETMIAELTAAFGELDAHDGIRAVVLAAEGPAFCAGADLSWMRRMAGYSDDENRADARRLARMLEAVYRCGKPVIARVHGDAYAGGVGLVAACDVAIGAEPARFCLSEARLGLIPATIAPYVVRALGERAARRYFTTAEVFGSARAAQLGLIHEAVPAEVLDAAVAQLGDALRANGPGAVRAAKRLVAEVAGRALDDALIEQTADWIAATRAGAEAREGIAAFLDKRTPSWRE